ncbi:MAG: hypothetical protein IPF92_07230 [Myxococcales bacterium]|jgi:hypothetical protein|nr:hypothetical protein [Myxococcales bacterium]HQY62852.1 hypothetical protein [Polyangiaceae bacterium]
MDSLDLRDLPPDLPVPELDLPPPRGVEGEAPRVEPGEPLELADAPAWHVATGVRTRACPVCQCELGLTQWACHECGERLGADSGLALAGSTVPARGDWRAEPPHAGGRGALAAIADAVPLGVGKRLLLYPLLAAFFCNLLIPCRFHETWACLVLALFGGVVVAAHRVAYRQWPAEE